MSDTEDNDFATILNDLGIELDEDTDVDNNAMSPEQRAIEHFFKGDKKKWDALTEDEKTCC